MASARARDERGGIVVGWLLKIVLVIGLIGLVAYDLVSIAYTKVATSDDARYIALGASEAIVLTHADDAEAIEMARTRAESRGVTLGKKDIVISPDRTVSVHVHRVANTLFVSRIGPVQKYGVIDETYSTPALG